MTGEDIAYHYTRNNCDVGEDCVQSKRRRELLGSNRLFGNMDFFDKDLISLVSGRKERRMQQTNGYQVYGALQCPSTPCFITPLPASHPIPFCAPLPK